MNINPLDSFRKLAASALLLAIAAAAPTLNAFEGKLDVKITNPAKSETPRALTIFIKNESMRADLPAADGNPAKSVILDHAKHTTTTLFPDSKTYAAQRAGREVAHKFSKDMTDTVFQATGRKEMIAGVEAIEYAGSSPSGGYVEFWVTKEMGKYLLGSPGMGESVNTGGLTTQAVWTKFAYTQDFFVLRAIERDEKAGPEKYRFEVTSIDKSSQADSLFQVPSDYTKAKKK